MLKGGGEDWKGAKSSNRKNEGRRMVQTQYANVIMNKREDFLIEMQCEKWCLLKKRSIGGWCYRRVYGWKYSIKGFSQIYIMFISYSVLILFQVKFI